MSVYRDKKEWDKWNEMALASEHAVEDFNDFADDNAIIQADKKMQSLLSENYKLKQENALLTKKLDGLENIDEISAGYRDLCKKMLTEMEEEGCGYVDYYEKKFKELEK